MEYLQTLWTISVSVYGPLPQPAWFRHDSLTSSVTLEEYSEAYALLYSNRSEARMKLQDFRGAADDGDEALKFLKALAALSGLNEETQALRRTRWCHGARVMLVVFALSCVYQESTEGFWYWCHFGKLSGIAIYRILSEARSFARRRSCVWLGLCKRCSACPKPCACCTTSEETIPNVKRCNAWPSPRAWHCVSRFGNLIPFLVLASLSESTIEMFGAGDPARKRTVAMFCMPCLLEPNSKYHFLKQDCVLHLLSRLL